MGSERVVPMTEYVEHATGGIAEEDIFALNSFRLRRVSSAELKKPHRSKTRRISPRVMFFCPLIYHTL